MNVRRLHSGRGIAQGGAGETVAASTSMRIGFD
jgi:hypothetical protein